MGHKLNKPALLSSVKIKGLLCDVMGGLFIAEYDSYILSAPSAVRLFCFMIHQGLNVCNKGLDRASEKKLKLVHFKPQRLNDLLAECLIG